MTKAIGIIKATLWFFCFGAVVLGIGVIWVLQDRVQLVAHTEQSDPLWATSKLQNELLNFNAELAEYAMGFSSPEDVSIRFEVLWSRVDILSEGRVAEVLRDIDIDRSVFSDLKHLLVTVDPLIQTLTNAEASQIDRLATAQKVLLLIDPYKSQMHQLSVSIAHAKSGLMFEFRNGLLSLSRAISYLGIVILVLAGVAVFLLILDLRFSKQKAEQLEELVATSEAALRAKASFMSTMSHEVRTPLTSILGGVSLFKAKYAESLDVEGGKLIDIVSNNTQRLINLVNDVLEVQSFSEGEVTLEKEYQDIRSIIAATIEKNDPLIANMNIKVIEADSETKLRVNVDEKRISQVLRNLLSNASKFSPKGAEVQIRAQRIGDFVRVEVVDSGIGVSPRDQEQLFSQFHQINPGTTVARKSIGLGLNIAKTIVEMHDGKIGVDSIEGQGATFWFDLLAAD